MQFAIPLSAATHASRQPGMVRISGIVGRPRSASMRQRTVPVPVQIGVRHWTAMERLAAATVHGTCCKGERHGSSGNRELKTATSRPNSNSSNGYDLGSPLPTHAEQAQSTVTVTVTATNQPALDYDRLRHRTWTRRCAGRRSQSRSTGSASNAPRAPPTPPTHAEQAQSTVTVTVTATNQPALDYDRLRHRTWTRRCAGRRSQSRSREREQCAPSAPNRHRRRSTPVPRMTAETVFFSCWRGERAAEARRAPQRVGARRRQR